MNSSVVGRPVERRARGLRGFAVVLTIPVALAIALFVAATPVRAGILVETDPSHYVPLDKIAPTSRDSVAEVIREHTLHRKSAPETFPCNPRVYLCLLNEPALTLALWQDLSASPVNAGRSRPNRRPKATTAPALRASGSSCTVRPSCTSCSASSIYITCCEKQGSWTPESS